MPHPLDEVHRPRLVRVEDQRLLRRVECIVELPGVERGARGIHVQLDVRDARRRARPWRIAARCCGDDGGRAGPAEGMVCWSLLATTCSRASARSDRMTLRSW